MDRPMLRRLVSSLALPALVAAPLVLCGACSQDQSYEFAVVLPLTGNWSVYGVPIRQGVELAVEQAQRRKLPYRIEIDLRDSESDPVRATEELRASFEGGAFAAVGGVTSESALAMVPVAEEMGRLLVSPSASSPELTGISRYFLRVFPSDFREGTTMANFVAQKLGVDHLVILAADSEYARGISKVFQTAFESHGNEVLKTIVYPEGTEDFSDLVSQALEQDPEAIYVADFAQPVSRILAEAKKQGFSGKLLTTSAFNAPEILAAAGENAEDVILTQTAFEPSTSEDPKVRDFVDAYQKEYGEVPGTFAAHGYDAMNVLLDALANLGLKSPGEMIKGIRSLGADYSGVTGAIQFDERGDVGQFPHVYILQDGKFEDYDRVRDANRQKILDRLEEIRRRRRQAFREGQRNP
jgi:branched-chain amino acid transport system substrate-binding protein